MKNYIVLTGFLIGLAIGVVIVGQQITVAYENAIHSEIQAKLIQGELDQAEADKKIENKNTVNKNL